MTILRIPSTSTETLSWDVTDTLGTVDPTTGTCEFQAVAVGIEPDGTGWVAGTWETTVTGRHQASVLLSGADGDGDVAPSAGTWDLWIRIAVGADDVRRRVATLIVT